MAHTRQAARRALRPPGPSAYINNIEAKPNRHARRSLTKIAVPVTTLPPVSLAWLAGLLEGKAWIGLRNLQTAVTIEGQPKLLTALRRRIGGVVEGNRWRMLGRRADAALLASLDLLVAQRQRAIVTLAWAERQRRTKGETKRNKHNAATIYTTSA